MQRCVPDVRTVRGIVSRAEEHGAVFVWFALTLIGILAFLGVAIDIGRMYIVRNESQAFVDAVALSAAAELDGSGAGLVRAVDSGTIVWSKFHFGARTFSAPQILFATSKNGPWSAAGSVPNPPLDYRFARATATVANLSMYLMPVVTSQQDATVAARAVAGQIRVTTAPEGLFPFAPIAHTINASAADGWGFVKGQSYALRWPTGAAKDLDSYVKGNKNAISGWCPGDQDPTFLAALAANPTVLGNEHGYIEDTSASAIRSTILGGYQTFEKTVGDSLDFSNGVKNTEYDALLARQDSDTNQVAYGVLARAPAVNWAAYKDTSSGYEAVPHNYRRIVVVPLAKPPDGPSPNTILDFASFLLETSAQFPGKNPHNALCFMYLGSGVEWTGHPGASKTGLYELRLVQ